MTVASVELCDLCARKSLHYSIDRVCCCLRLLRDAPAGQHRRAMALHMAATAPDDVWKKTIELARDEGLTA